MSKVNLKKQAAEAHVKRAIDLAWRERPRKPRSALKELRLAIALDPGSAMAHLQIGNILNSFGEHRRKEARVEFEAVIRLAPEWAEGYGRMAHLLWEERQRKEAIAQWKMMDHDGATWNDEKWSVADARRKLKKHSPRS